MSKWSGNGEVLEKWHLRADERLQGHASLEGGASEYTGFTFAGRATRRSLRCWASTRRRGAIGQEGSWQWRVGTRTRSVKRYALFKPVAAASSSRRPDPSR